MTTGSQQQEQTIRSEQPRTTNSQFTMVAKLIMSSSGRNKNSSIGGVPGAFRKGSRRKSQNDLIIPSDTDSSNSRRDLSSAELYTARPLRSCLSCENLLDKNTPSSDVPRRPRMKKTVSFHVAEVREHPRTLGDNPSVSCGPALALDWYRPEVCRTYSIPLMQDENEEQEKDSKSNRLEFWKPQAEREFILRQEAGVSRSQMARAKREACKIQQSRRKNAMERTWSMPNLLAVIAPGNKSEDKELKRLMEQAELVAQVRRKSLEEQRTKALQEAAEVMTDATEEGSGAEVESQDGEIWEF